MKRRKRKKLKVHRNFKLAPDVDTTLRGLSRDTNITQTRLVEMAVRDMAARKAA